MAFSFLAQYRSTINLSSIGHPKPFCPLGTCRASERHFHPPFSVPSLIKSPNAENGYSFIKFFLFAFFQFHYSTSAPKKKVIFLNSHSFSTTSPLTLWKTRWKMWKTLAGGGSGTRFLWGNFLERKVPPHPFKELSKEGYLLYNFASPLAVLLANRHRAVGTLV